MILSLILVAIFAQQIAPYDYDEPHKQDRLQAPNSTYLFGTDDFGRDMFSKVIYGTRITLWVALLGTSIQLFLGVVVGLLCGYFGGWVDSVMMRVIEVMMSLPYLLVVILVMLVLAYPIAFYCHRALARLCLSGANPSGNITETVEEHFGAAGQVRNQILFLRG